MKCSRPPNGQLERQSHTWPIHDPASRLGEERNPRLEVGQRAAERKSPELPGLQIPRVVMVQRSGAGLLKVNPSEPLFCSSSTDELGECWRRSRICAIIVNSACSSTRSRPWRAERRLDGAPTASPAGATGSGRTPRRTPRRWGQAPHPAAPRGSRRITNLLPEALAPRDHEGCRDRRRRPPLQLAQSQRRCALWIVGAAVRGT